jgi:rRNA maturation RNase YbeY
MRQLSEKIRFFNTGLKFSFSKRNKFRSFLQKIAQQEGKKLVSINYIFCSDQELLKLNKQFLNHDFYTDILTFNLSDSKKELLAEIFISIPRIKENARTLRQSFQMELYRVMVHGLLHLCSYDDKTQMQIKRIRMAEDKYLQIFTHRFM